MSTSVVLSLAIICIPLVSGALLMFVYIVRSAFQEYRRDRIPVLLYHRFISREKTPPTAVLKGDSSYVTYDTDFDAQMAYLHRVGYRTISLDDFLAYKNGLITLPAKPIILTFDDGFSSNFHYAFPVLKRYGMTATIFVTPDTESENFKRYAARDSPLSHGQMQEMSAHGISIQSHGMTHRYLSELEPEVVSWELAESKKVLEAIVGKPVDYLAIPSGAYNRTVRRIAEETGYKAVFCMLKGSNNKDSDVYALRRLVIGLDLSLKDFSRILQPAAACYFRFTSCVQNALLIILGPGGLDAFRDRLFRLGLGSLVARGQLKYIVPSVGLAAFLFVTIFVLILQRHF